MKILNNLVLVKPIEKEKVTKSGILLIEDERDYPMIEGKVINKDEYIEDKDIKIGDIVMFGSETGKEIVLEDNKLWLVYLPDILFIKG